VYLRWVVSRFPKCQLRQPTFALSAIARAAVCDLPAVTDRATARRRANADQVFDQYFQKGAGFGIAPGSNKCGYFYNCSRFGFLPNATDITDSPSCVVKAVLH